MSPSIGDRQNCSDLFQAPECLLKAGEAPVRLEFLTQYLQMMVIGQHTNACIAQSS